MKFKINEGMFVATCEYDVDNSCIYYQLYIALNENGNRIAFYYPFINNVRRIENVNCRTKEEISEFMHKYIRKRSQYHSDGQFNIYTWKGKLVAVELYSASFNEHFIIINAIHTGDIVVRFMEESNTWQGRLYGYEDIDAHGEVIKEIKEGE